MPLLFNLSLISLVFKLNLRIWSQTASQRTRIKVSRAKRIIPFHPPIHWNKLPNSLFLLFKRKNLSPMPLFPSPCQTHDWRFRFCGFPGLLPIHWASWNFLINQLLWGLGSFPPPHPPHNLTPTKIQPKSWASWYRAIKLKFIRNPSLKRCFLTSGLSAK